MRLNSPLFLGILPIFILLSNFARGDALNSLPPKTVPTTTQITNSSNIFQNEIYEINSYSQLNQNLSEDVRFCLFSDPDNPDVYQLLQIDQLSTPLPCWNPTLPVKILIHGFLTNISSRFPENVKNAYLKKQKDHGHAKLYNIVVVDWSKLAGDWIGDYLSSINHVVPVGKTIGLFITRLLSNHKIGSYSQIHVIGHSLGAHVSGAAGGYVIEHGGKIGRISGLDPAGPLFYVKAGISQGRQLRNDDAKFVDVHHCNMGMLGTSDSVGTVQWYLNELPISREIQIQPQCETLILLDIECSHAYCPKFWALSILERRTGVTADGRMAVFGEDMNVT
ncbi:Pancreatic lipase-related protein 2 [Folsomia candida]|uniref:Pancreatic lipase-related protein 2 n=2 Tax=Folsomia candida TaxID=158441 RepID=A0A226F3Q7_FOLCA|nr:Pancreatic lipase-related protein 2 [Folsomia candida]